MKISIIIPTKDRPQELRRLLNSIQNQTRMPDQIIIVDSSKIPDNNLVNEFSKLPLTYEHTNKIGLTKQRNLALSLVNSDIDLICFLDDDTYLLKDAIEKMLLFWETASNDVGGAVFNIINDKQPSLLVFFKSIFCMGGYERGKVHRSGFNTSICPAKTTKFTDWLFGGATVWRKEIFKTFKFDEWFEGYGFCEDLDFSYSVSKKYKLAVVADAKIEHLKGPTARINSLLFGKTQILNRYYFIKKDSYFSKPLFFWSSLGMMLENLFRGLITFKVYYIIRFLGNINGILMIIFYEFFKIEIFKTIPKQEKR